MLPADLAADDLARAGRIGDEHGLVVVEARLAGGSGAMTSTDAGRKLRVFVVAGEHSGDALGEKLMAALNAARPGGIVYGGVGAEGNGTAGFGPALSDVRRGGDGTAVDPAATAADREARLRAVDAALAFAPDVVVVIDAPEFTHPIAKRIAKRMPQVPIIDYVSPSVWAWRPGPRATHAPLHRSRDGAAAVRAGGASAVSAAHPVPIPVIR